MFVLPFSFNDPLCPTIIHKVSKRDYYHFFFYNNAEGYIRQSTKAEGISNILIDSRREEASQS